MFFNWTLKKILKSIILFRTPLHLAVAANHLSVSQHLLSEDAKLQVFDKDNRSPLILVSFLN